MKPSRLLFALAALLSSTTLFASACSSSDEVAGDPSGSDDGDDDGSDDGSGASGPSGGACLLHNCESDEQCAGCSDGRTTCLLEEKRCVACGPGGGSCPAGQECSSFGQCVPEGLECPTDSGGVPTITCSTSADCAACDPAHQVCDGQKCVSCTATDTSECQSTDVCSDGKCAPACPTQCHIDNDCNKCGTAEHPAKACNAHKCAECSPTYACAAGMICTDNGTCIKPCGIPDQDGVCDSDADCTGCGGDTNENYVCDFPINGGLHGKCKLTAAGCSDLGQGTVVLPPPWNQVTEACSNDGDCAGVGIELNVGKILRDLTGIDEINDANVDYGMNVCADVELAGNLSCGVCVPCRVDADCNDIDIDVLALEAFGPLGSIAAAILLDQVFGPNEHTVFMYCEQVTSEYGVCAPCPGVLSDCSNKGGGGGSGSCDHEVEDQGGPLDPSCSTCAADVCDVDPYCCDTGWDATCVGEVDQYCSSATCGHSECSSGGALSDDCNDCTWSVCGYDPYCCENTWDSQCVSEAGSDYNCSC